MPQGKGTYGSKVGRPPKKDKYQDGGSIDPFSAKNPEGVIAEKIMEAKEGLNSIPTVNAMERSQVSPMGNEVGTGVYKEGGKVTDENKWYPGKIIKDVATKRQKKRIAKVDKKLSDEKAYSDELDQAIKDTPKGVPSRTEFIKESFKTSKKVQKLKDKKSKMQGRWPSSADKK